MSKANVTVANWGKWETKFDTQDLLGEIVVLDISDVSIHKDQMRQAAADAGLVETIRSVGYADAGRRAVSKIRRTQIVTQMADDAEKICYSFGQSTVNQSPETMTGFDVVFNQNAQVCIDKKTGKVTATDEETKQTMQTLVDHEYNFRNTSDVTSFCNKTFRRNADMFQLKSTGGSYFVPAMHAGVCDAIGAFLAKVGGRLRRYPVAKGRLTGDTDIREAVQSGLQVMLDEARQNIQAFSTDELDTKKLQAAYENLGLIGFKIETYSEYLQGQSEVLKKESEQLKKTIKAKIVAFIDGGESEEEKGATVDPEGEGDDQEPQTGAVAAATA